MASAKHSRRSWRSSAENAAVKPLSFCDHHRQRYAEKVPIPEAGEFLIGAYEDDGATGGDGEFRVTLVELHGDRRWSLYPHLEVYGEGVPALHRAIDAGLLDVVPIDVDGSEIVNRRDRPFGRLADDSKDRARRSRGNGRGRPSRKHSRSRLFLSQARLRQGPLVLDPSGQKRLRPLKLRPFA